MKDWEDHSIHVIESLKRIEKKLDVYDTKFNDHVSDESNRIAKLEGKINETRQELKFHSRLGSMIAILAGSVISWFIESRRNG